MSVADRVEKFKREIEHPSSSAVLIAVSKLQNLDQIRAAYNSGQHLFGENYVQELLPKMEQLQNLSLEWHFIGPLQSNKARKIVGKVEMIHSVDRVSLMQEISRQCVQLNCKQKVLLQVNLSGEASKSGITKNELKDLVEEGNRLPGIVLCGLMTMPPLSFTPEQSRPLFRQLKQIFDDLKNGVVKDQEHWKHLSMGTSQDYLVALEEGATMVRLGTQVFGPREE